MSGNIFVCDVGTLLWRNGRLGTAVKNVNGHSRRSVGQATSAQMFVLFVVTSLASRNGNGRRGIVLIGANNGQSGCGQNDTPNRGYRDT